MNLQEILHLLAEGISLAGPVREEVHQAIEDLDKPREAETPEPAAGDPAAGA
jgi:hypothetical protein